VTVRATSIPRGEGVPLSKPAGGYQLIPAVYLALAWWAYHQGVIRLADLRVWFACWEMRARRCRCPAPLPRRFAFDELERLTGLAPRRLKAAIRRLEAARLLRWSEAAVGFPAVAEALAVLDGDGFRRLFDLIPNHDRRVPVPRRILRLLAGGCRPAMIATIVGHLIRCLYLKGGVCSSIGRVKASWVAEVFGVGLRRVKQARRELVAMGWLIVLATPQWMLNRWGGLVRIALDWSAPAPGPVLAPPAPPPGPVLAPPDSDEEPLTGARNQEPAPGGPAGFYRAQPEEKSPKGAGLGDPDLRHVVPEDLADTGRLLELYAQAVARGLVSASEWGRLRFVAAAEHARVIGTKNPCGLFVRLVRGGSLHFATEDDATAASVRLRRHLYGGATPGPAAGQGGLARPVPLSEDARLVRAVRVAAARAGYRGDAFPLLKRQRPEWTHERWERAVSELDG
jgi:hypothetical protein